MASFEEFKKLELKIAKIIEAQRVENSEKLLRLKVDSGEPDLPSGRQIIAGIGKNYDPESLIGKEIVIISNLDSRMLMGLESQGMLLAANDNGPVILVPEREVPPGSIIS